MERHPWWRGRRGEWYVGLQLCLFALAVFGPTGASKWPAPLAALAGPAGMALIVVGLFVGSSIVYYAGMKPIIFGIPVVGFMGYVIAFILSAWIVFDIYFKGRSNKKR